MASAAGSKRSGLVPNIISGLATGLFSIPEGMAYAQIAGVNPVYGMYSGIVATIVTSLSAGTVLMMSTLTSAIALTTASVMQNAGIQNSQMPQALFTITFLTGAIMFLLGILRLGSIVNFVSNAVMTGFVAAASLLIILGQEHHLTGYSPVGANQWQKTINWLQNISQWDWTTVIVSLVVIVFMVALKRIRPLEKYAAIIVLFVGSVVVNALHIQTELIASIATIPNSLPKFMLPSFSLSPELILGSVSVTLVALAQGAGISTAVPNPDGSKASSSRDFIGEGLGNLAGSFFQSMSTGGSLSRTGVSVGAGATNRLGGVFAGLWLGLVVLLFGSYAEKVPLAIIGGMLTVIGVELITARVPSARLVIRTRSWGPITAMALTFFSSLFIPLQWAIFLGAFLSLMLYLSVSASKGKLFQFVRGEDGYWQEHDLPKSFPSNQATVIAYRGANFFAEVPAIMDKMPSLEGVKNAVIIWRLRGLEETHSTFLKQLSLFAKKTHAGGNRFMLEGVEPQVMQMLEKTGLLDEIGRENVFEVQPGMGAALDAAWKEAQKWLGSKTGEQQALPSDGDA
jgi:SulP family sulfate permease